MLPDEVNIPIQMKPSDILRPLPPELIALRKQILLQKLMILEQRLQNPGMEEDQMKSNIIERAQQEKDRGFLYNLLFGGPPIVPMLPLKEKFLYR